VNDMPHSLLVSCILDLFALANGLCYTMGNNTHGQLGIGEPYIE
jgi:hypothetical protein